MYLNFYIPEFVIGVIVGILVTCMVLVFKELM